MASKEGVSIPMDMPRHSRYTPKASAPIMIARCSTAYPHHPRSQSAWPPPRFSRTISPSWRRRTGSTTESVRAGAQFRASAARDISMAVAGRRTALARVRGGAGQFRTCQSPIQTNQGYAHSASMSTARGGRERAASNRSVPLSQLTGVTTPLRFPTDPVSQTPAPACKHRRRRGTQAGRSEQSPPHDLPQ